MSLALLLHYLMLNMFRMLIHPSSGACDLFVELFHGLYCSGMMRVGVTLWFVCGGVVWCGVGWCGAAANICRNTLSNTTTHVTTKHSPINKCANAKISILTEQYNP